MGLLACPFLASVYHSAHSIYLKADDDGVGDADGGGDDADDLQCYHHLQGLHLRSHEDVNLQDKQTEF